MLGNAEVGKSGLVWRRTTRNTRQELEEMRTKRENIYIIVQISYRHTFSLLTACPLLLHKFFCSRTTRLSFQKFDMQHCHVVLNQGCSNRGPQIQNGILALNNGNAQKKNEIFFRTTCPRCMKFGMESGSKDYIGQSSGRLKLNF